jgi:hypothetical protein
MYENLRNNVVQKYQLKIEIEISRICFVQIILDAPLYISEKERGGG